MLYVITGASQSTGAKMRMEIEASNRAAAERAAKKSGIEVLHCHAADDDPATHSHARTSHREEVCEGKACAKLMALGGLVLIGLLVWLLM